MNRYIGALIAITIGVIVGTVLRMIFPARPDANAVRCAGHNLDGAQCGEILDCGDAIHQRGLYFCSEDHAMANQADEAY